MSSLINLQKLFSDILTSISTYREINHDYQKALNEELSDEQLEILSSSIS